LPDEPRPTTAFIRTLVSDTIVNDVAGVPQKVTAVNPLKFAPYITTLLPVVADVGKIDETVGDPAGAIKVKPVFDAVPTLFVTLTLPDEPGTTIALMYSIESTP
ncbi:MAG: hypothetical protein LH478_03860, partial [Chitinophagaceae bacterium]|nr:hypothetical protein [Chitinophagaceae bacterium]